MKRLLPVSALLCCLLLARCGSVARSAPPEARLEQAKPAVHARYAVLVNGDTERRHNRNIVEAYGALRALGFEPDRIYTLTTRNPRVALPAEARRLSPVPKEFWHVADALVARAAPGDLLFLYATGHGDTDRGESLVALRRGELWARDLRDEIDRWPGDAIIVMDQCFSGGFADALAGTKARVLIVTTVDARHETDCSTFAHTFWNTLRGNSSVRQAFEAALRAHQEALADDRELKADGTLRSFNGFKDAILR